MKLRFSNKKIGLAIAGVVAVAAVGGYLWWSRRATADEYMTAKIERGTIRNTVAATGTLQAVTTVQVGSQVSGTISALFADFNTNVRKGEVVAQLDPAIFQAQVASARANVESARANLVDAQAKVLAAKSSTENLRAGVSSANANLAALRAQRDDALNLLRRQEALAAGGIVPERDLESARTTFRSAEARFNQASAQVEQARLSEQSSAGAGIAQAEAQVKQAQAQLQQSQASVLLSEVNLSHTTIKSPIDGVVVSRNVDVGQTVAASLSAPTLFTIANDLTQMQVIANIDQADIGVINQSNRVNFTVDAFPGENFNGSIRQIRLNPQNVQNVVTYNVVIDVNNPDLKLKPGMTANLTMTIAERTDAVKVPNAAFRFRPSNVTPEQLREMLRAGGGGREEKSGSAEKPAGEQKGAPVAATPEAATKDRTSAAPGQTERRDPGGTEGSRAQRNEGERPTGERSGRRFDQRSGEASGGERPAGDGSGRKWGQRSGEGSGERTGRSESRTGPGQQPRTGARPDSRSSQTRPSGDQPASQDAGRSRGPVTMPMGTAVLAGQTRIVWVLGPGNKPEPRRVKVGITDGTATEIISGEIKEGDTVIVGQNVSGDARSNAQQRPPGFGGAPQGGMGGGRPGGAGGGGGGGGVRR